MKDTLDIGIQSLNSVPDFSTRLTVLVVICLILTVTIVIMYFRMKEIDKDAEIN